MAIGRSILPDLGVPHGASTASTNRARHVAARIASALRTDMATATTSATAVVPAKA